MSFSHSAERCSSTFCVILSSFSLFVRKGHAGLFCCLFDLNFRSLRCQEKAEVADSSLRSHSHPLLCSDGSLLPEMPPRAGAAEVPADACARPRDLGLGVFRGAMGSADRNVYQPQNPRTDPDSPHNPSQVPRALPSGGLPQLEEGAEVGRADRDRRREEDSARTRRRRGSQALVGEKEPRNRMQGHGTLGPTTASPEPRHPPEGTREPNLPRIFQEEPRRLIPGVRLGTETGLRPPRILNYKVGGSSTLLNLRQLP